MLSVVLILFMVLPAAASTEGDVQFLLAELESRASVHLQADLALPDLLPDDGIHRAHPFWHTGRYAARGGSLAIVFPTAVRVGRELRKLQAQGAEFTSTPTVQRILLATERWDRFMAQPWLPSITADLERSVRELAASSGMEPDQLFVDAAMGARVPMASRLLIGEVAEVNIEPEIPRSDEVWWYECYPGDDNCRVQVECHPAAPVEPDRQ